MTLLRRLRAGLTGTSARDVPSVNTSGQPPEGTSMDGLREAARAARSHIHAGEDVLPMWAVVMALGILDKVGAVLTGELDSSLRIAASSLIRNHFPGTFDAAIRALSSPRGVVDEDALFRQLRVLMAASESLVDDVHALDARRLAIQERFLTERYETTDLLGGMP